MSDEEPISAKEKLKSIFARIQDPEIRDKILASVDDMQDDAAVVLLEKWQDLEGQYKEIQGTELKIATLESRVCKLENKLH